MSRFHLVEFNAGSLHHPIDAPESAEFAAALEPINLLAEASPGFVWRLTDEDGLGSSYIDVSDDPRDAVNLSVWESHEALSHYVYKSGHVAYLRRRREWFEKPPEIETVCWWTEAGSIPTLDEAWGRLEMLRRDGPSDEAFTFTEPRSAPDVG
jgi:hypothetical protein